MDELGYGALAHRGRLDGAHRDPDRMRRIKALYFGLATHIDACVGRTLDDLEALGLAETTVVIFTADHGEMLGDHGLSQKNVPFEASIRIPLIVRWPGLTDGGRTVDGFASLLDLFPTLIGGLNIPAPATDDDLPGTDLHQVLKGERQAPRAMVVDYGYGSDRWALSEDRQVQVHLLVCGRFRGTLRSPRRPGRDQEPVDP